MKNFCLQLHLKELNITLKNIRNYVFSVLRRNIKHLIMSPLKNHFSSKRGDEDSDFFYALCRAI